MSPSAPRYTPYPFVNEAVHELLKNVQQTLGEYFLGLYLHGSLAGGDFDPGRSDIDFLVVTTREIPKILIPELEAMHKRIWMTGTEWMKKFEGTYIPVKSLYRYDASDPPRPHVNKDKFMFFPNEQYWVIERHILREKGVVIAGPPIRLLIASITSDELRKAVVTGIREAWPSRVIDGEWLDPDGYQPYMVLTCCRVLYTLRYGTVRPKTTSAKWALKTLDRQWYDLISDALAWRNGMPNGNNQRTLEMMKFTLARVEAFQPRLSGNL